MWFKEEQVAYLLVTTYTNEIYILYLQCMWDLLKINLKRLYFKFG